MIELELLRIELQRKSKGISRTPQDALTPYLTRSTNSLNQKSFFHEPQRFSKNFITTSKWHKIGFPVWRRVRRFKKSCSEINNDVGLSMGGTYSATIVCQTVGHYTRLSLYIEVSKLK